MAGDPGDSKRIQLKRKLTEKKFKLFFIIFDNLLFEMIIANDYDRPSLYEELYEKLGKIVNKLLFFQRVNALTLYII